MKPRPELNGLNVKATIYPKHTKVKQCTKCGKTKSLDEFYNNSRSKTGKNQQCKTCVEIRNKKAFNKLPKEEQDRRIKEHTKSVSKWAKEHRESYREQNKYNFEKWINKKDNRKIHNSKRITPMKDKLYKFISVIENAEKKKNYNAKNKKKNEIKSLMCYKYSNDEKITKRMYEIVTKHIEKKGYKFK